MALLRGEKNALHIQPIEVKTRDDSFDSTITKEDGNSSFAITGHAANQVASIGNVEGNLLCR